MSLKDVLHWRYAPKRMTGGRVPDEQIESILTAAQFAPTSMGLQPFSLVLISDDALREQIFPIAYGQAQVREASHLLVFAAYTALTEQHIDKYLADIVRTRGVSEASLEAFRNSMMRFKAGCDEAAIKFWATNQAYLALGFAVAEAALLGVDATPMEGFDAAALDKLLQLDTKAHTSVALLAIGFRDEEKDIFAREKKVRRSLNELVIRMPGGASENTF